ncbi:hypothetical protein QSV34_02125 [Porticoccus sp. W117]|uniref:hypothetical protein n=1 Tax=Porticoccus sp. W117 TaxID=3054777 RepID=UPI002596B3FE|nr:hypothetical protein [Porticoccus sp. W117]MDM3870146.1 hypothetical protein [Porticoccus sp. W117]
MDNTEWNSTKDVILMLTELKNHNEERFNGYVKDLQLFYIDCCEQKLDLLPQESFKIALRTAESFINGGVTNEQVSHQNWYTEADVFGMDYDEPPFDNREIYENISQKLGLTFDDARDYAVRLGYFIDWSSLYAQSFNGRIPKQHSEFLDSEILKKYIVEPFA